MPGALRSLRKATTTLLAATMVATGVTASILDRGDFNATELIDVRHEGSCVQHHNHAICVVLGSTAKILTAASTPALGTASPVLPHPAIGRSEPARRDVFSNRSRAPPV